MHLSHLCLISFPQPVHPALRSPVAAAAVVVVVVVADVVVVDVDNKSVAKLTSGIKQNHLTSESASGGTKNHFSCQSKEEI